MRRRRVNCGRVGVGGFCLALPRLAANDPVSIHDSEAISSNGMSGNMKLLAYLRLVHRAWRYRLHTEHAEVRFMLDVLGPGQCVVDVGAAQSCFYLLDGEGCGAARSGVGV